MRIPKGGVAFFDSGIGGLTVLAACKKCQGDVPFYYYGDNTHAPYGNLPVKKIRKYVFKAFKRFLRLKVRAAVIACNTATAVCVEELRKKFPFPIIGAEPAVCLAAERGGKVAVLATRATCESERFGALCERARRLFPEAEIRAYPCEGLAGEIEQKIFDREYDYTAHLPKISADAVVLGCTHYIYIVEQIRRFYACPIYDGNEGIARRLSIVLQQKTDGENFACENREKQPPSEKNAPILGLLTTERGRRGERQKISNKRSQKYSKKRPKTRKCGEVIFLGKQRKNNEKTYKQTFV